MSRFTNFFIVSSSWMLLITGIAKLISAIIGRDWILSKTDPIFSITFQNVVFIAALIELAVALVCLIGKNKFMQAGLLVAVTNLFLLYRFGLYWLGYGIWCPCLGSITGVLHISAQAADTAMKIILVYMLIGSYTVLYYLWRQKDSTKLEVLRSK